MGRSLFDDGDGGDEGGGSGALGLPINRQYADKLQRRKKREELSQLKRRHGQAEPESSSSDGEDEDEDAVQDTPATEQQFLKTLAALKTNDPRIMDKEVSFFHEPSAAEMAAGGVGVGKGGKKRKAAKPMYLKDHERMRILTKGVKAFVSDDEDEDGNETGGPVPGSTVYEQQRAKKKLLSELAVAEEEEAAMAADGEDDGDSFFTPRTKTGAQQEQEERDYTAWLADEGADVDLEPTLQEELEPLKRFWTDPSLPEGDKFLRDYITKRLWKFEEPTQAYIPEVADSEDEAAVDDQEQYERDYNFRFEESDGNTIKSYPRDIRDSMRNKKTARADARQRRKEAKEQKRREKAEELSRLRTLKEKEVEAKLKQLKDIVGEDVRGLEQLNLDGEFDDDFDKQLATMFDDRFYEGEEDEEKPTFSPLPDDSDGYGGPGGEGAAEGAHGYAGDDGEAAYDAGYGADDGYAEGYEGDDAGFAVDENGDVAFYGDDDDGDTRGYTASSHAGDGKAGKRRRLDPAEKQEAVRRAKGVSKSVAEMQDLGYEDVIAGGEIATRFKYRRVPANDFGLSVEEILLADDKELNQWVGVRKMSQYRSAEEERQDQRLFKKRARNKKRKYQVFQSLIITEKREERRQAREAKEDEGHEQLGAEGMDSADDAPGDAGPAAATEEEGADAEATTTTTTTTTTATKKKKKKKKKKGDREKGSSSADKGPSAPAASGTRPTKLAIPAARLAAYKSTAKKK